MICEVRIVWFILVLLWPISLLAQSDTTSGSSGKIHPMLEIGVLTGGEVSDGLFIYRNAKLAELSLNLKGGEKCFYGLGSGIEKFRNDFYVPVFIQFKGMTKRRGSSGFISIQAGYGITNSSRQYRSLNLESKGGIFFSPGMGYKLKLEKHLVLLSINYKHQFNSVEYKGISETTYQYESNLHMVSFKAGIVLD